MWKVPCKGLFEGGKVCWPVEPSWKSGRVRWKDGFLGLGLGLVSRRSGTGILLLSSVSLQHRLCFQWIKANLKQHLTPIERNVCYVNGNINKNKRKSDTIRWNIRLITLQCCEVDRQRSRASASWVKGRHVKPNPQLKVVHKYPFSLEQNLIHLN